MHSKDCNYYYYLLLLLLLRGGFLSCNDVAKGLGPTKS